MNAQLTFRTQGMLERLGRADRILAEHGQATAGLEINLEALRKETAERLAPLSLSDREAVRGLALRALEDELDIAEEFIAPVFEATNRSVAAVREQMSGHDPKENAETFEIGTDKSPFSYSPPNNSTWEKWIANLYRKLVNESIEAAEFGSAIFLLKHRLESIDSYLESTAGLTVVSVGAPTDSNHRAIPLTPYKDISPNAFNYVTGKNLPPASTWLTIGRAIVNISESVNYSAKSKVKFIIEMLEMESLIGTSELGRYIVREEYALRAFDTAALTRVMKEHGAGAFGPVEGPGRS